MDERTLAMTKALKILELFSNVTNNIGLRQTQSNSYRKDISINGHQYQFEFDILPGGKLRFRFMRDGTFQQTGDVSVSEIIKALNLVMSGIDQILRDRSDIQYLIWAADEREPSRVKLYSRFAKRLASKYSGRVSSKSHEKGYRLFKIEL